MYMLSMFSKGQDTKEHDRFLFPEGWNMKWGDLDDVGS